MRGDDTPFTSTQFSLLRTLARVGFAPLAVRLFHEAHVKILATAMSFMG
jgi:hypothetical protein